jgi:hypothetical protein
VVADEGERDVGRVRRAARRAEQVRVRRKADESYVLVARQPSGAITIVPPTERTTRSTRASSEVVFDVPIGTAPPSVAPGERVRRGVAAAVLKWVVLKFAGKLADRAVEALGKAWEKRRWKSAKRPTGLVRVTRGSLETGKFAPVAPGSLAGGPTLVLVHGTFSHAQNAFGGLAKSGEALFDFARRRYGDRIVALQHFTVSVPPSENAGELVAALGAAGARECDVITHSRGGLVALEWVQAVAGRSGEPRPSRAVLVASPTRGTPLAEGGRWDRMMSVIANLLDLVPNPFAEAASFVATALGWIARRLAGGLPGLASMDPTGETIAKLSRATFADLRVRALVSDYEPPAALLKRAVDFGADAFFRNANDLVVPTDGGGFLSGESLPSGSIGRYGKNGTLTEPSDPVSHCTFFDHESTAEFLVESLRGTVPVLRSAGERRAAGTIAIRPPSPITLTGEVVAPRRAPDAIDGVEPARAAILPSGFEVGVPVSYPPLQLTFLPMRRGEHKNRYATLLATYGSARAFADLDLQGNALAELRKTHESIREFLDGAPGAREPTDAELVEYGTRLFDTLFPDAIGRLYDTARARQRDELLEIVVTSAHPALSELPWEFAFDPVRRSWIATEEVLFVRNVVTAIPADDLEPHGAPLSILVVSAQPLGTAELDKNTEEQEIRASFERLERLELAKVTVIARATPAALHSHVQSGAFDVLHFIGHGEYDAQADRGYLIFEDANGARQDLDVRAIRDILSHRGIRLVYLNACDTGRGDRVDFNSGVAPGLVAAGVPAVVANQYKVFDTAAVGFADHFYWSLAHGATIGAAAREARISMNYLMYGDTIDWAVPVVYARDARRMRLVNPSSGDRWKATFEYGHNTRVRGVNDRRIRVGLWDSRRTFAGLAEHVEMLNDVQSVYCFEEITKVVVPLGTWQRRRVRGEVHEYLHAEYVTNRLRGLPQSLGLKYLLCLTDLPLMGSKTLNLLAWWDPEACFAVLSSADVDLGPDGERRYHALTNGVVSVLGALLTGRRHHRGPPRYCPFYYNGERDERIITGSLKIDPKCAKHVREQGGDESLEALSSLLRALDRPPRRRSRADASPEI